MTTHQNPRLYAGAYALNAVEPHERHVYEQHLRESELARVEADEFMITAAHLASLSEPVAPDSSVKRSIMMKIMQIPQCVTPVEETMPESNAPTAERPPSVAGPSELIT